MITYSPATRDVPVSAPDDVLSWVDSIASLTEPTEVRWFTGTEEQQSEIADQMVSDGTLIRLNPELRPNSYLARSAAADVARVEERTFICSVDKEDRKSVV